MDVDEIKKILELMREHDLGEFELEQDNVKLRLRKNSASSWSAAPPVPQMAYPPPADPGARAAAAAPPGAPATVLTAADDDVDFAIVKSPIVGTFFRAAEPNAPPFVDVGALVKKGEVLCIIEAMKLMNEIDSEYDGEIVKVYVENGQPVQYGERLFAIKPNV
jgi:acetyl-CoA carboxylase biotin carboxyl carrier protein